MNAPPGAPNPYAPPSAQPAAVAPLPAGPIPTSVIVAVVATSITILVGLATEALNVVNGSGSVERLGGNVVIGGLIVVGMYKGHRLAWQWGRIVGVLYLLFIGLALLGIMAKLSTMGAAGVVALAVSALMAACVLATVICLSAPSAYAHFRLVCPQCAQRTTTAADFLFQKAKCKRCNLVF